MKKRVSVWEYGSTEAVNHCSSTTPPLTYYTTHSHSSRSRLGLTLIEVLLAVAILGVGAGVLMLATARCLAVISQSRHYSAAQRLILQVGAENPLTRAAIEAKSESGKFSDDPDYTWDREIIEPENENQKGLYTVRTRVSWSDRGRESFEQVVTWHYIQPEETP